MKEKLYEVYDADSHHLLASNMTFAMAIVFIRGYRNTYYADILNLTIKEQCDETIEESPDRSKDEDDGTW